MVWRSILLWLASKLRTTIDTIFFRVRSAVVKVQVCAPYCNVFRVSVSSETCVQCSVL
uniref:Uncharacterized protein n=1 Tax=Arundo donax TaxID=35708 RepID=A0A0A8ZTH7_ARUDO